MEFNGTSTLDLSAVASGIYILGVHDSNTNVFFKRIVKH
ncbi:hypothetical protein [Formosa algae]|nr:hypothetical protein [Formosa algae]